MLEPGEFYTVGGRDGQSTEEFHTTMYVREEEIRGRTWCVFAAYEEDNPNLIRVRVPEDNSTIFRKTVHSDELVSSNIISERHGPYRSRGITKFLLDAYITQIKRDFKPENLGLPEDKLSKSLLERITKQHKVDHPLFYPK